MTGGTGVSWRLSARGAVRRKLLQCFHLLHHFAHTWALCAFTVLCHHDTSSKGLKKKKEEQEKTAEIFTSMKPCRPTAAFFFFLYFSAAVSSPPALSYTDAIINTYCEMLPHFTGGCLFTEAFITLQSCCKPAFGLLPRFQWRRWTGRLCLVMKELHKHAVGQILSYI